MPIERERQMAGAVRREGSRVVPRREFGHASLARREFGHASLTGVYHHLWQRLWPRVQGRGLLPACRFVVCVHVTHSVLTCVSRMVWLCHQGLICIVYQHSGRMLRVFRLVGVALCEARIVDHMVERSQECFPGSHLLHCLNTA